MLAVPLMYMCQVFSYSYSVHVAILRTLRKRFFRGGPLYVCDNVRGETLIIWTNFFFLRLSGRRITSINNKMGFGVEAPTVLRFSFWINVMKSSFVERERATVLCCSMRSMSNTREHCQVFSKLRQTVSADCNLATAMSWRQLVYIRPDCSTGLPTS